MALAVVLVAMSLRGQWLWAVSLRQRLRRPVAVVAGLAVVWSGQKATLATAVVPTAVCFSFAVAGLEAAQLVAAGYVESALSILQELFTCGRRCAVQLVAAAYVGSALLFLPALFCWWLASCCATYKIGHLLPGHLQRRSHSRRH